MRPPYRGAPMRYSTGMFQGKNYRQIVKELYGLQRHGIRPALGPTKKLLALLGDPHKRFPAFHVAGTNGKGSTAAMIAASLSAAGYRTGAYYSPHVQEFRERFLIDGAFCSQAEIFDTLQWMGRIHAAAVKEGAAPRYLTFFEWSTALAFCLFARARVDVAVLETGMGGRFDATNVVSPEAAVITNVTPEHRAILGATVEAIAAEKAGIVKPRRPVICGSGDAKVRQVIAAAARRKKATAYFIGGDFKITPRGRFTGAGGERLALAPAMAGRFQLANAACAAQALLAQRRFTVPHRAIEQGIAAARLPGRFEMAARGRNTIVYDVAHNPAAIRALAKNLRAAGLAPCDFLVGMLDDKDFAAMLRALKPVARKVHCIKPDPARGIEAGTLAAAARAAGLDAAAVKGKAVRLRGILCVTGSFTTVEAGKRIFG